MYTEEYESRHMYALHVCLCYATYIQQGIQYSSFAIVKGRVCPSCLLQYSLRLYLWSDDVGHTFVYTVTACLTN